MSKKIKPGGRKAKQKDTIVFSFVQNRKTIIALLSVLCFVLYFNTLSYDYCGDDTILIKENKLVNSGLSHATLLLTKGTFYGYNNQNYGAYRPLAMLSFATEAQLFGLNPFVGHLINILLYSACCILLYYLLLQFFPDKNLIALLITLLFLSHPLHSEVVANIKSRDELFAFLLSFLIPAFLFLRYGRANKIIFISALLSFYFGLFAKESAVTLLVPVTLSLWFFSSKKPKEILLLYFTPMLLLAGIYLIIRNIFLDSPTDEQLSVTNTLYHAQSFSEKTGTFLFIQLKNLEKIFFPLNLSWDYSYKQIPVTNLFSVPALFSLLIISGVLTYAVLKLKSKNPFAYFILFYGASILLFTHLLVMLAPTMADRFLFIPSLAICASVVLLPESLIKKTKKNRTIYFTAPIIIVTVLFSVRTIARNSVWKNNETMFRSGIKDSPNSYYVYQTLGQYLSATADSSKDDATKKQLYAEAVLEKGNNICPEVQDNWYLQGRCAYLSGDFTKAEYAYLQSIIRFDKPKKESVYNLAVLYKEQKNFDKAIEWLNRVNTIEEDFMNSYSLIGEIYLYKNDFKNAETALTKSLEKDPRNETVLNNLGVCYFSIKSYEKARELFSRSVSYYPCSFNGLKNLAATYQTEAKIKAAIACYEKLIQCYPNNPLGYQNIISLYSSIGDKAKVIEYQNKLNTLH